MGDIGLELDVSFGLPDLKLEISFGVFSLEGWNRCHEVPETAWKRGRT